MQPTTIAILGSGQWGKALANLANFNHHRVKFWSRRGAQSLLGVVEGAKIILSAVSMAGVRSVVEQVSALPICPDTIFVSATKGLEADLGRTTQVCTASQIWQTAFPDQAIVVLSGPNLSKEIEQGLPAATVVASRDEMAAKTVQVIFSSPNFRVYTNPDPLGVELGGILKNVIAIAVGSCDALQLGANAKAALVTRGLSEMIRIATAWGAKPETFYGLAGLGDLLATCNSPLSRNYQVGYGLALGKPLAEILGTLTGTAEGINTAQVLMAIARQQNIPMPISHQVYRLIQGEVTAQTALEELMLRNMKSEYEFSEENNLNS